MNPFSDNGRAPSADRSAAARMASAVAGLPASARSTAGRRHGTVPTPPAATRADRIVEPCMSSATAAEQIANSYDVRSRTLRYPDRRAGVAGTSTAVIN